MRKDRFVTPSVVLAVLLLQASAALAQGQPAVYPGVTVTASYGYNISGRTDRVKGYLIKIDNPQSLKNPGLIFLARSISTPGQALLRVNNKDYAVPAMEVDYSGRVKAAAVRPTRRGGAGVVAGDPGGEDVVAKIVIPLKAEDLRPGINQVEFSKSQNGDPFAIIGAQIQDVTQTQPAVIGATYHLLSRSLPPKIKDFDAVFSLKPDDRRMVADTPAWGRMGLVNYYRSGEGKDKERMLQMYKEAHINLVSAGVPRERNSEAFKNAKALIEKYHAMGIRVASHNTLGGVPLQQVLENPESESWVARDEYGNKLWMVNGSSFATDISSPAYRQAVLYHAETQIDAGADELYYDYGLGGTGDVRTLFEEIRAIATRKGKNISLYGNCKGNILVDEVADVVKTEGTEEAGVWDGRWVHNMPQARFYYATGDGGKRYESKYEGADPGVPNPGAHDVQDGMKAGWRKPIAEAAAFQSDFAIAESGPRLLEGWANQNNPVGIKTWKEICDYFGFKDQNKDLLADISTVSKIGVLAPPHIPSFEVALTREALYRALSEMNIMYEIVMLHRVNSAQMLAKYKTIIVTDIPWMDATQSAALEGFKRAGGKIYTIGSAKKYRDLADATAPAEIFGKLADPAVRKQLAETLRGLEGEPLVTVDGPYIAANLVKKNGQNRYILHLVNYDKPVKNLKVKVNLEGVAAQLDSKSLRLYSPDAVSKTVNVTASTGKTVEFQVPDLDVWDVIAIN